MSKEWRHVTSVSGSLFFPSRYLRGRMDVIVVGGRKEGRDEGHTKDHAALVFMPFRLHGFTSFDGIQASQLTDRHMGFLIVLNLFSYLLSHRHAFPLTQLITNRRSVINATLLCLIYPLYRLIA